MLKHKMLKIKMFREIKMLPGNQTSMKMNKQTQK